MLNGSAVLEIMARTLGIAIVLDVTARHFLIVPIPWYATTVVLTLFMYACESSANYQARLEMAERFDKLEGDVKELREKLVTVEQDASAALERAEDGRVFDPLWEEVKALWNGVDALRKLR